jgi:hypothetical protein
LLPHHRPQKRGRYVAPLAKRLCSCCRAVESRALARPPGLRASAVNPAAFRLLQPSCLRKQPVICSPLSPASSTPFRKEVALRVRHCAWTEVKLAPDVCTGLSLCGYACRLRVLQSEQDVCANVQYVNYLPLHTAGASNVMGEVQVYWMAPRSRDPGIESTVDDGLVSRCVGLLACAPALRSSAGVAGRSLEVPA